MGVNGDAAVSLGLASSSKRTVRASNSPAVGARASTPPPAIDRNHFDGGNHRDSQGGRRGRNGARLSDASSHDLDLDAANHALRREVLSRQSRETTPNGSPHRKRQRITGDRYAPCFGGNTWECRSDADVMLIQVYSNSLWTRPTCQFQSSS